MRVPRAAARAAGASAIHYGIGLDEQSAAALSIALDAMQAYAVLITLGFTIVLIFFLAFCVCSRKEDSYSDCYDYEGIRTVRMSHHTHDGHIGTDQTSQASSRCTMKRELPAIPDSDVIGNKSQGSTTGSSGPTRPIGGVQVLPSATAGPLTSKGGSSHSGHSPRPSSDAHIVSSSSTVSSDLTARQTSHSSFGSGPSKEHQYAHLKRTKEEHPYAKVGGDPETDTDNYDDPRVVTGDLKKKNELKQKSHYETVTETTKKSTHSSIGDSAALYPPSLVSSQNQKRSPSLEIQASSAITGSIPANEELPYMTPKTQVPSASTVSPPARSPGLSQLGEGFAAATSPSSATREDQQSQESQQQHFSGDSQDSRGYSSFSVREPLSALRGVGTQPSSIPPHMQQEGYYMTVSDDSADETYACIYDRTSTVTQSTSGGVSIDSNQQTYAQIQKPTSSSSSTAPLPPSSPPPPVERSVSSPSPLPDPTSCDPPAPPSVDSLKHVLHSRQASAGSTSGVISSPSSEKRGGPLSGTRSSPLPPLPQGADQMYYEAGPPGPPPPSATSPPHSGPGSPMKTSMSRSSEQATQMALEDMYAKVMKKRDSHTIMDEMLDTSKALTLDSPPHSSGPKSSTKSFSQTTTWSIVGVVGGPPSAPKPPPSDPGYETVHNDYPTYETVKNGKEDSEPGYETVKNGKEDSEPGYETVKGGNEGYETVNSSRPYDTEPGYESVQSGRPVSECDSNYEQLKFTTPQPYSGYESVAENNYEKIKEYGSEKQSDSYPMYAEIKKSPVREIPVYASVQKKTSAEPPSSLMDFDPLESSAIPPPVLMSSFEEQSNGHGRGYSETDDEGLDSPPPNKNKYKRSLEEEAALLVSTVEESAINILSSRNGSNSDKPEIVSMITKEEALAKTEDLLSLGDLTAVNAGSEGSSDTSSDAVFSRKITYEQPKTLPGLVSNSLENGDDCVENGSEEGSTLLKKDSGSVETESARDTAKASIEVQNGSHHTSVDNSSSGREDISPEDEVCMPPNETADEGEEEPPPPPLSDMEENQEEEQMDDGEGSPTPHTPTVLSIPVPQQSFYSTEEQTSDIVPPPPIEQTSDIVPPPPMEPTPMDTVPPPPMEDTPMDTVEDDLPEQDQQLLPSPPPVAPLLNMEEDSSQFDGACVPPPPSDLLSDAPECDLPPPLPPVDIPPPMTDEPLPPPMVPTSNDSAMNVTINPMAEIDELSSMVKKACQDDLSPIAPEK